MELDKLTQIQKASINYHTSELSLINREYERKEEKEKSGSWLKNY